MESTFRRMALLVIVAPATTSTFVLFASAMAAGSFSRATPPLSGVSFGPSAVTLVTMLLVSVTVVVTAPPKPCDEAVKVPEIPEMAVATGAPVTVAAAAFVAATGDAVTVVAAACAA